MRHNYVSIAAQKGIGNALILVKESWGAQLISRMWALGVPHSDTETLYRGVDTCVLESAVSNLERRGLRGVDALQVLRPLLRDSARVIKSEISTDQTERVLPGLLYDSICVRRIGEDRSGYTFLAPILASAQGSNVYARDLHAWDTMLLRDYRDRSVYILRPTSSEMGALLELVPFAMDSARAEWRSSGNH
jgi:hypothetical protein